jgi:hypothetical protein
MSAILDAIEGESDVGKMRQNGTPDPKRFWMTSTLLYCTTLLWLGTMTAATSSPNLLGALAD